MNENGQIDDAADANGRTTPSKPISYPGKGDVVVSVTRKKEAESPAPHEAIKQS